MHLIISNSSDKPIYEQIVDQFKQKIVSNELLSGEMLPSIRGLAKDLRISVITTKRAYEELEREGYIETVAGKGSFVATTNKELHREEMLCKIEEHLQEAIRLSYYSDTSKEELIKLFDYLYEEKRHE